jgi:hypothetical protein
MDRTVTLKMQARPRGPPDIWNMAVHGVEMTNSRRAADFLAVTAAIGIAGGAAISLLAFLLARYGPAGDDWSFRGNGALAAYALAPAILGGAAGLLGVALGAADAALLPVFGPGADRTAGPGLLFALLAWMVIAPAVATRIPGGPSQESTAIGVSIGAAFIWLAGVLVGLAALGFVLPAGS